MSETKRPPESTSETHEALPELLYLSDKDQIQIRTAFEFLRSDPAGSEREFKVYNRDRGDVVGVLDYDPDIHPPVRVRVGKNIFVLGNQRYRITLEDRRFLNEVAQRPARKRAEEWVPMVTPLHPEAAKHLKESAERDPLRDMERLLGRVYGPDEVETAFSLMSGNRLVTFDTQTREDLIAELGKKLREPAIEQLIIFLRKDPKEARCWELVLEANTDDDFTDLAINDLYMALNDDTDERGIGSLVSQADHELYWQNFFYTEQTLRDVQPGRAPCTWRLVRTKPLPSSLGRAPRDFSGLLERFCRDNHLDEFERLVFASGRQPENILPRPVEAFYRWMLKVRNGEQPPKDRAEWTAYKKDVMVRGAVIGPWSADGIMLEECDLSESRQTAGFNLSIPL